MANFKEQRDLLRAINAELGKQTSNIKNATKEISKLESVTRKLQDVNEENITLTDRQAQKEAERANAAFAQLEREATALQESLNRRERSAASLTAEEKALLIAKRNRFTVEKQVVIANIDKSFELANDTGEDGYILIPSNLDDDIRTNLDYFLDLAGMGGDTGDTPERIPNKKE